MASTPLLSQFQVGEAVDLTIQPLRRICRLSGERIAMCPHCHRRGMRRLLLNGKIQFVHYLQMGEVNIVPMDACTMWERTEFKLRYGHDGIHPKYHKYGDEDANVEEIRPKKESSKS